MGECLCVCGRVSVGVYFVFMNECSWVSVNECSLAWASVSMRMSVNVCGWVSVWGVYSRVSEDE